MKRIADRSKKYLATVCFFVFTVCLYGPFSTYLQNAEDYWFSFGMFASAVIPVTLAVAAVLVLLSWFLPETRRHIIVKLFFGLTLAMYIQGNYINIRYGSGVLDGTEINWGEYTTYAIWDTAVWVICLAVPFVIDLIVKKSDKKFFRILTFASLFLIAIQIPAFVSDAVSYHPAENKDYSISKDNMFDIGKSDNVLVFVLDTMDEAYYKEFIEDHPEYTAELEGFVHYDNAAAAGCRTYIGVPAMFTGTPYTRNELYSEYLHRVWSRPNAFSALHDAGYKVNVYSETLLFSSDATAYVENFHDGRGSVGSYLGLVTRIYKMDLYKYAPHLCKRFFWMYSGEFDEVRDVRKDNPYDLDDVAFFADFTGKGFNIDASVDKAVQVYHLEGAHSPYDMDENGEKTKKGTQANQVAGCFYRISQMLRDLRDKGMYDETTIMITTDHGDLHQGQYAMFLLKKAGDKETYRTSPAPVSHFDLPIYLASLAGKELKNEYGMTYEEAEKAENRERHMFYNTSGNSKPIINEYVTRGAAGDFSGWQLKESYEGSASSVEPYELGTTLSFASEATGNTYTAEGFGNNTGFRTKTYGPSTVLKIPVGDLPGSGQLKATLRFSPAPDYRYSILANGNEVFSSDSASKKPGKKITFRIPADTFGEDRVLTLEIRFPEIDPAEMEKSVKQRTPTGGLVSLLIEKE